MQNIWDDQQKRLEALNKVAAEVKCKNAELRRITERTAFEHKLYGYILGIISTQGLAK